MWTISQLKERGKAAFKKNYWRAVLIAMVVSVLGASQGSTVTGGIFSGIGQGVSGAVTDSGSSGSKAESDSHSHSYDDEMDEYFGDYDIDDDIFEEYWDDYDYDDDIDYHFEFEDNGSSDAVSGAVAAGVVIIVILVLFVVGILSLLLRIFLFNPIEVGCTRFFVKNLTEEGRVGELGFAFDRGYKNHVYIMFMRSLFTFLWSLLCVIPGVYKSYEYRMIPYLLTEYPNLSKDQAFSVSKQMMNGYKMKAFILDLSFIGWWILNVFTCGILGLLYVEPYYQSTAAAFYEALKGYNGIPGLAAPMWSAQQTGAGQQQYGTQQAGFGQQQYGTQQAGFGQQYGTQQAYGQTQPGNDTGVKPAAVDPIQESDTGVKPAAVDPALGSDTGVKPAAVDPTPENDTGVKPAAVDPISSENAED